MAAPDTQRGERGAVWAVGLLRPCRCHGPRCHRDLVLSGGWPAWWGCGPPAQPSALALQQPVHGGDTDGSCRTTVGRHRPHPRGGIRIPPRRRKRRDGGPRRPISPTKAVSWLARPDAHGVRLLTDLADRTVGEHGGARRSARGAWRRRSLAGIQPQRWSQAGELALGATGLSAAYCCRRPPVVFHSCCRDPQLDAVLSPAPKRRVFGGGLRGVDHMHTLRSLRVVHISTGSITPSSPPTPLYRRPSFVWIFG